MRRALQTGTRTSRGFSLIELLVVLAIIGIVAVLAIPSISLALVGSRIDSAGQMISDSFGQARQEAVAKDRDVQVRFYKLTSGWCAFQIFRAEPSASGSTLVAVTPVRLLPQGIVISSTLSPLLTADAAISGTVTLPVYGATAYAGFYFLPSGQTESALTTQNNYVTVQGAHASGSPPSNYSTLQINLVTGKVEAYRP